MTWLYGPLQAGSNSFRSRVPADSVELTKFNSFLDKEPILKKQSVSELMLQQSLSTSSLLMRAKTTQQAQNNNDVGRPGCSHIGRTFSDYVALPLSSHWANLGNFSLARSLKSSEFVSSSVGRKHIYFMSRWSSASLWRRKTKTRMN